MFITFESMTNVVFLVDGYPDRERELIEKPNYDYL